jgi:hypothetical protein
MDMTMIATLTGTGWNNANAFLGVGDSSTAEAATQTELQAATNRFYKAMNATFPSSCFSDFFVPVGFHDYGSELCLGRVDDFIGCDYGIGCRLHHGYHESQPQGCGSRY